jgi:hypothetical protein
LTVTAPLGSVVDVQYVAPATEPEHAPAPGEMSYA